MKSIHAALSGVIVATAVAAIAASPAGQKDPWVRGKVTSVSGSTITVSSGGKDMVFTVDKDTDIIQRGAGTKTREAQREGRSGVPLDTLIKAGDRVEVHYRDMNGKLHATMIRGGVATDDEMGGGPAQAAQRESSASGTVTAVSDTSLTIKTSNGERTFAIDAKTRVEGPRFGTRTREMQEKGEKPTLTKFIQTDDEVTVLYNEAADKSRAEEVRLVRRPPGRR